MDAAKYFYLEKCIKKNGDLIQALFRFKIVKELGVYLNPVCLNIVLYDALSDRFYQWPIFSPISLKVDFKSETNVCGVVLTADADKQCLNIEIRLKNRQTGYL